MKVKNYVLESIGDGYEKITAQEAAAVTKLWSDGAKFVIVNGNVYATHQIKSISRIGWEDELMLLDKLGILPVPRLEETKEQVEAELEKVRFMADKLKNVRHGEEFAARIPLIENRLADIDPSVDVEAKYEEDKRKYEVEKKRLRDEYGIEKALKKSPKLLS